MASLAKVCQFCGIIGPHPKAHIFPKALYRGKSGVAFHVISASGGEPIKRSRTGIYDSNLWCATCEKKSSQLDNHVAKYFLAAENYLKPTFHTTGKPFVGSDGRVLLWTFDGIDSMKLHLFVISVLWRASASRRSEFIRFSLGRYQEVFKDLLQNTCGAKLAQFPFLLGYESNPDLQSGFMLPVRTKFNGVNVIRFHGGGFSFNIKVDKRYWHSDFIALENGPNKRVLVMQSDIAKTKEFRLLAEGARKARSHKHSYKSVPTTTS